MKKNLLAIAALAAAFSASAQVEALFVSEDCGLTTTKATTDAGTVIASGEAGTLKLAYTDEWGLGGIDANGYNSIRVNGESFRVPNGAVGNANPGGWSVTTAATSGAVFQFDAEKDGYLTIPSKYSSNKNYWVFEGLAGEGELCLAYVFGMQQAAFEGGRLDYSIPADTDGYLDFNAADFDKYVDGTSIRWPEKIFLGGDAADVKVNGYGVMMFPVYAGCKYLFGAQGSKMTCPGVIYTAEAPVATIFGEEDAETPEMTFSFTGDNNGDTSAIENIIANEAADENAPIYNVMGQRVTKEYKGVLIQNGKKFVNF